MTIQELMEGMRGVTPHELERFYATARVEMNAVLTEDQVRHIDRSVDRDGMVREGSFK